MVLALPPAVPPSPPACLVVAAQRQTLPVVLLQAVEKVEGGWIGLRKLNANGSIDYGKLQINTVWAKFFHKKYGIGEDELANDQCLGYEAAAYVLRHEMNTCKGFWCGVMRYNSPDKKRGYEYAGRVYRAAISLGATIEGLI